MRKPLLIAALACVVMSPIHAEQSRPAAYDTRTVPVGSFEKLKIVGPFKVSARTGGSPQVILTGPPVMLADTIVDTSDNRLTVRFRKGAKWSWNRDAGVNVEIVAPRLTSVGVEASGRLDVVRPESAAFTAATSGSGSIRLVDLKANEVQFSIGGSGSITASGDAQNGAYSIGGSGSIDARRLRVATANIAIGGSGSVDAYATRAASISVGGSGSVSVEGGATCVKQPTNSARIVCR